MIATSILLLTLVNIAVPVTSASKVGPSLPHERLIRRQAGASSSPYLATCQKIQSGLSKAAKLEYPQYFGDLQVNKAYSKAIYHAVANAQQPSACVVTPANNADVSVILKAVGSDKTPFAVKSGGHTCNPGFSSTPGVHIDLSAFSTTVYNNKTQTAKVGTGQVWDKVYAALEPTGRVVLGARVTNIGVGGFILGGGYSWQTGEYGLASDQVVSYDLVLPNGTFKTVTSKDSDLFFALHGGLNKFGIVTSVTLNTVPQGKVWSASLMYDKAYVKDVLTAVNNFDKTYTDPKAVYIASILYLFGAPGVTLNLFYNAPTPPKGLYDGFLNIPSISKSVNTVSYLAHVQSSPSDAVNGNRGLFATVPTYNYSKTVTDEIYKQVVKYGSAGSKSHSTFNYGINIEPYPKTFLCSKASQTPSAYPRSCAKPFRPLHFIAYWNNNTGTSEDAWHLSALRNTTKALSNAVVKDGQTGAGLNSAPLYPNYALYDEPAKSLYRENLPRLQQIKKAVDPKAIMDLAGGFKLL